MSVRPECWFVTLNVPSITGYESRACSDSEESSEVDCVLEPLSDRCLVKLSLCRPFAREEQPPGDSPTPEATRRGPGTCGASIMTDSAESEASDSANTESRGCRTSGSSESMDALEEDDLDACSSSRTSFFHFGPPGFSKGLEIDSQEENSRVETSGFLCLLDLAQNANPRCQKLEGPQGLASEACSWGPELSMGRLDPRLYEGSRTDYYSLCSSVSPGSRLSDSGSESTASRQVAAPPAWCQQGWMEAQPSSMLETLALPPLPPLPFEDGSSDEEYYDAADKLTPPDTLSGEPLAPPSQLICTLSPMPAREQNIPSSTLESMNQLISLVALSQGCKGSLRNGGPGSNERNSSHCGNQGRLPRRGVKWAAPCQVDSQGRNGVRYYGSWGYLRWVIGATRWTISGV